MNFRYFYFFIECSVFVLPDLIFENAMENALLAYQKDDLISTEKYVEIALRTSPLNLEALQLQSIVHLASDRHESAVKIMEKLIDLGGGSNPINYANYVEALRSTGEYSKARKVGYEALNLYPESAPLLLNVAAIESETENYDQALSIIEKSINLNPTSTRAWNLAGNILFALGKFDIAENLYTNAVEYVKNDSLVWFRLGAAKHRLDKIEEALPCYQKYNNLIEIRNII